MRFLFHLFHYWQSPRASADHQSPALPRYVLLNGKRRMPEFFLVLFGRLLLPFADLSSIDHHIVFVSGSINADRSKRECFEAQPILRIFGSLRVGIWFVHSYYPNITITNS